MNSQQCLTMMAALKSGCQSDAEFWQAVAELQRPGAGAAPEPKRRGPLPLAERTPEQQAAHAAKKAARAAEKASGGSAPAAAAAAAEPKPPSAWLTLVAHTVKQMAEQGWTSWTDAKGNLWAGSVKAPDGRHVYAEGPHAGKAPSHQRGGMARASYLKTHVVGLEGEWALMELE